MNSPTIHNNLNIYEFNNRARNVRQKLIKLQREIDESTIMVGDSNTPLSEEDRSSMQKISKNTVELNSTINQLDVVYM